MVAKIDSQDLDVLARTIYGEARGEFLKKDGGMQSLQAIGWVVINRLKDKKYGESIKGICQKQWQFSCWNNNDNNCDVIKNVTVNDAYFQRCMIAALQVISSSVDDCTNGADHYHNTLIEKPFWANDAKITTQIGNHIFYKLGA